MFPCRHKVLPFVYFSGTFAVFVQRCKAAHDVRNLPLCTVYVVLLLPSWCCKAQLLTIYLADPCRFDEIFQTKFFSHTTSFYHIWASDACAVQGCRSWGCQGVGGTLQHPQTDHLTLFRLGGVDYAHNITTCPNKFSYLPAALQCACCVLMSGQQQ